MAKKAKKTDVEVVEVKEIYDDILGYNGEDLEYRPQYEKMGSLIVAPYTVTLRPMSDSDMIEINTINRQTQLEYQVWLSGKPKAFQNTLVNEVKKDTVEDLQPVMEANNYYRKIQKTAQKLAIARQYVSNIQGHTFLNCDGVVSGVDWVKLPVMVRADIYNKIVEISQVDEIDTINLS